MQGLKENAHSQPYSPIVFPSSIQHLPVTSMTSPHKSRVAAHLAGKAWVKLKSEGCSFQGNRGLRKTTTRSNTASESEDRTGSRTETSARGPQAP